MGTAANNSTFKGGFLNVWFKKKKNSWEKNANISCDHGKPPLIHLPSEVVYKGGVESPLKGCLNNNNNNAGISSGNGSRR